MPPTDVNTAATLVSVAGLWTVAVITPGPNFFLTVRTALGQSRLAALGNVSGSACGTVVWGLCGFFGLALLFQAAPWLYGTLKLLGGGYLIFLGFQLVSRRIAHSLPAGDPTLTPPGFFSAWRRGLLTNLANPKTAAFVTSLFAASMPADAPIWLGLTSVIVMTMLSIAWYAAVACMFSTPQFAGLYQLGHHWVDRLAGMVFMTFGARLIVDR